MLLDLSGSQCRTSMFMETTKLMMNESSLKTCSIIPRLTPCNCYLTDTEWILLFAATPELSISWLKYWTINYRLYQQFNEKLYCLKRHLTMAMKFPIRSSTLGTFRIKCKLEILFKNSIIIDNKSSKSPLIIWWLTLVSAKIFCVSIQPLQQINWRFHDERLVVFYFIFFYTLSHQLSKE